MIRKTYTLPILLPLLVLGWSAKADDLPQGSASALPEKISFLVTFGEEICPDASDPDEIVVCATAPEGDRYRIPKELRKGEEEATASQSWTSAVESLDDSARVMRPNSCSVVGTGGFTGCTQAMLREWFAARRGTIDAN
ncbi:hypothetical protein DXH95_07000 [Sphingorhabdus pulchriflava]|uniref:Uncharacterized protein n=1 Tax=Sphingorhabdus pulchriflava TaxID=2292257 RepID=A0A371BHU1_9SPHN|nr:hypothetical protein [Sphingorhabdus pulchriflava]RDV07120.1 hypothetical protein DXH95_07000 [Sphingorhabdus pulchriflava]